MPLAPELVHRLNNLPDSPGVYVMKTHGGEIVYIGKAKSLRDRVRSYFSGADTRAFVALLEDLLWDIEVILTHSNKEAMILENELIKRNQPRFNVKLTDDKRYLCLRLDIRKTYPRLEVVRRFAQDGARYFGPYHSAGGIRETLRIINRHFQLRTCSDQVLRSRSRPCLQYQIKRCPAPCVFDLSGGEYTQNVNDVTAFLEGRTQELLTQLKTRMHEKSSALEFEAAGVLRDQMMAVTKSLERQRMVSTDLTSRDVVGLYRQGPRVEIYILRTRDGKLIDGQRFTLQDTELPTSEVLADFAVRYYAEVGTDLPDEILFPEAMEWGEALAQVLSDKKQVDVLVPKRGDKKRLVELAERNAEHAFVDKQRQEGAAQTAIERLQLSLHLSRAPVRIECFDISHLQGTHIVASCVRFEQGMPRKALYRHYKIRSTLQQDDFQSMYEVVSRRAVRGIEENNLPDLIVIDGGKGQLAAAKAALDDHGVDGVDLISLAKARQEDESPERVFVLGNKNPIILRQDSAENFILVRVRNEAHRFAITFNRLLRRRAAKTSFLDGIEGVGPKRRKALLQAFGSVARLQEAPLEEIAKIAGSKVAKKIVAALEKRQQNVNIMSTKR